MLALFVPLLYYHISETIFTYIFPVCELVHLEIICPIQVQFSGEWL